jgi:protein-tyrosine phosphatase
MENNNSSNVETVSIINEVTPIKTHTNETIININTENINNPSINVEVIGNDKNNIKKKDPTISIIGDPVNITNSVTLDSKIKNISKTFCSIVCHGRIGFGRYPTQYQVDKLTKMNFSVFVDLTDFPKTFYVAPITVKFPIRDGTVPLESMRPLIQKLLKLIEKNNKVYIHCEHGRGRSAMLTCCLIASLYKMDYDKVIAVINDAHKRGHGNSDKWHGKLIPPHQCQRDYIKGFLDAC